MAGGCGIGDPDQPGDTRETNARLGEMKVWDTDQPGNTRETTQGCPGERRKGSGAPTSRERLGGPSWVAGGCGIGDPDQPGDIRENKMGHEPQRRHRYELLNSSNQFVHFRSAACCRCKIRCRLCAELPCCRQSLVPCVWAPWVLRCRSGCRTLVVI